MGRSLTSTSASSLVLMNLKRDSSIEAMRVELIGGVALDYSFTTSATAFSIDISSPLSSLFLFFDYQTFRPTCNSFFKNFISYIDSKQDVKLHVRVF